MNIRERINNLSPIFPETLKQIEVFRKKERQEIEELIEIIEKDTLLTANLLKIVNSSMFGFRSKVETLSRAINLLGMNFAIAIAISQSVKESFKINLSAYCINCKDFMDSSIFASLLAKLWSEQIDYEYKEDIFLGAILQDIGKFIISEIILEKGFDIEFQKEIQLAENEISFIEKKYLYITASEVTAEIFKYWNLSENLIKMIEFVDNIENCPFEYKQKAQMLDVIKTACSVNSLLSDKSIKKALNKAKSYNFHLDSLEKVRRNLQEKRRCND